MFKLVLIGLILHVCILKASSQGTTNTLVCSKGSGWYTTRMRGPVAVKFYLV